MKLKEYRDTSDRETQEDKVRDEFCIGPTFSGKVSIEYFRGGDKVLSVRVDTEEAENIINLLNSAIEAVESKQGE